MQAVEGGDHVALQWIQRREVLQQLPALGAVVGLQGFIGGEHVAQFGAILERLIQGGDAAGFCQQVAHALQWHVGRGGQLMQGGLNAMLLQVLLGDGGQPANLLAVMARQAHHARLAVHMAVHRLADPPVGVGAELVAAGRIKPLDGTHQAKVGHLDQVILLTEPLQVPAPLADEAHRQAQVGSHEPITCPQAAATQPSRAAIRAVWVILPGTHQSAKVELLGWGKEGDPAD